MKTIIHRDKNTHEILHDFNEYETLVRQGKSDEDIAKLVEKYNDNERSLDFAEIVELDEVAGFYRKLKNKAYTDALGDMAELADNLESLASEVQAYMRRAKRRINYEHKL